MAFRLGRALSGGCCTLSTCVRPRRTARTRQQTLRATIEWSHDLLTGEERVLFRRLAIFAGGFTLEAAEDVCASGGIARRQIVDLLARLVDKSLVSVTGQRFRL